VNRSVSHAHRTVGAKPGSGFFSKRVYRHNSSFRYSFKFYFSAAGLADRRGGYQRLISLMRPCCLSCQPMSLSSQGKITLQPKLLQPGFARLHPAVSNQRQCRDHFLAVCPALAHQSRRPLFTISSRVSILTRPRRPTLKRRVMHIH